MIVTEIEPPRRSWARRLRPAALSLLAGVLLCASVPPWGWWPLAIGGIALWDRVLADASPRARFGRSWLLGAAWFAPSMLWMLDLTAPGYPIAVAVFAAYVGLAGMAVPGRSADPRWRWLAVPAAFTLAEAARSTFPFGGVPLATVAMGQAAAPLGQIARIACALGVTFAVGVVGVALSAALAHRRRFAALTLLGVVVAWQLAVHAPAGHDLRSIDVAVVQGGGPQHTHRATSNADEVFARHLEATTHIVDPVDLIVWPENVVDVEGPISANPENIALSGIARRHDATLLAGVTEGVDGSHFLNASIVYLPDGTIGERYDKVRRVPFGEYVPMRGLLEWLTGGGSGLPERDAIAGTGPAVVHTPAGTLAVAISWEVFFTNRGRDGVEHGGELLINPTNGSSYWLSMVQTQQVASSRLRAIENGRWVLQAAPTGFSAIVDPDGRVEQRTSISEQAVLQQAVMLRSGRTIATTVGPLPVVGLSILCVASAWAIPARRARRQRAQGLAERTPPRV